MLLRSAGQFVYTIHMRKKKRKENSERWSGHLEKHRAGFGFVRQEDGEDIFIARSNMNGAMNGDLVQVDLLPEYLWQKSKEGIIDRVLERKNSEIVGTFQKNKKFGFVIPDDKKNPDEVFVRKSDSKNARSGTRSLYRLPGIRKKISVQKGRSVRSFPAGENREARSKR